MPSLAQLIANRFIGQQVNLLRLSASEREKVFTMLGALQARVLAKMETQIPLPGFGTFTQQKLAALYRLTDKLMDQAYSAISSLNDTTLVDVSQFQSQQARKIVNSLIGVPLMTVGLPLNSLKALVDDDLVDGRPAAYWWDQQAMTLKQRYRDEIRQGVFAGETLGQMKQRIRGTKAQNYQDGIMAVTSRNADALIRTSILSVANAARYETLKANDDVLDGQQWVNTLDPRTCPVCQALGNQAWDFTGNKMEGTTQDFPGPPPQHFNCRCTLVPVLKSWAQMQRDAGEDDTLGKKLDKIEDDLGPGTRASMGGPVSADLSYEDWLNTQDVAMQKDILGAKRFDMWQQGLIDFHDMVDMRNRPLTLDEIMVRSIIPPMRGGAPEDEILLPAVSWKIAEAIKEIHWNADGEGIATVLRGGDIPKSGTVFAATDAKLAGEFAENRKLLVLEFDQGYIAEVGSKKWLEEATGKWRDVLEYYTPEGLIAEAPQAFLKYLADNGWAGFSTAGGALIRIENRTLAQLRYRNPTKLSEMQRKS